jgi:hypothetical protein
MSGRKGMKRHGLTKTPTYAAWEAMRSRCHKKNYAAYPRYGGRGIQIDPRWHDYPSFLTDMGAKPSREHSLDRIDNEGNYSKDNCRWATREEQANNTSRNKKFMFNNQLLSIAQISRATGISDSTLWNRLLRQGLSVEAAVLGKKSAS